MVSQSLVIEQPARELRIRVKFLHASRAFVEMGKTNNFELLLEFGRSAFLGCFSSARKPKTVSGIPRTRSSSPPPIVLFVTKFISILAFLMLQPPCAKAQFDMVVFEKRPPQAKSREELSAVLDIVQTTDLQKIAPLCSNFRKQFPNSEFLGHVYRMEMHAYAGLNDPQKVIATGEKALEVNSHDVDALLTVANAIPNGVGDLAPESAALLDKAESYARRALDEIDGLHATRGVTLDRWRKLTGRMRSSAQEALGFTAFKRGNYAASVAELEKSIRFNPEADGSLFFRLGVAYLYDGKVLEAQVALERSSALGPEYIRTKAQEQLAKLGKQNSPRK